MGIPVDPVVAEVATARMAKKGPPVNCWMVLVLKVEPISIKLVPSIVPETFTRSVDEVSQPVT